MEIKEGSIVQLKSGGPAMTANWVSEELGTMQVNCDWFIQDKAPWKKENATFPLTSLKLIDQ